MGGVQLYPEAIDDWFQIFLINKFQIPQPLPFQTLIVNQNILSLGQSSQVKCPTYLSALPLLGQDIDRCIKSSLRKHPFLLAVPRQGRFARRNFCDSAAEIPYWRRKPMFT